MEMEPAQKSENTSPLPTLRLHAAYEDLLIEHDGHVCIGDKLDILQHRPERRDHLDVPAPLARKSGLGGEGAIEAREFPPDLMAVEIDAQAADAKAIERRQRLR